VPYAREKASEQDNKRACAHASFARAKNRLSGKIVLGFNDSKFMGSSDYENRLFLNDQKS